MLSKGQRPKAQASGLLRYTNKAHSDPLESALVYFPLVLQLMLHMNITHLKKFFVYIFFPQLCLLSTAAGNLAPSSFLPTQFQ